MNLQLVRLIVSLVLEFLRNINLKVDNNNNLNFVVEAVKEDPQNAVESILKQNFSPTELLKIVNELKSKL